MVRLALWVVCVVVFAGCVGPQFGSLKRAAALDAAAPAGVARLVLVRPRAFLASGTTPFVIERSSLRAFTESPSGSIVTLNVAPGEYEFCLVAPMLNQVGWRYLNWFSETGLRTPLTRVEVAAGQTYVFEVRVGRGVMELVPARRGSSRLRRLEEGLPALEVYNPILEAPELQAEPQDLAPWMETCVDSTAPDRWRMSVDDGK